MEDQCLSVTMAKIDFYEVSAGTDSPYILSHSLVTHTAAKHHQFAASRSGVPGFHLSTCLASKHQADSTNQADLFRRTDDDRRTTA
jgi:hypothetical protein